MPCKVFHPSVLLPFKQEFWTLSKEGQFCQFWFFLCSSCCLMHFWILFSLPPDECIAVHIYFTGKLHRKGHRCAHNKKITVFWFTYSSREWKLCRFSFRLQTKPIFSPFPSSGFPFKFVRDSCCVYTPPTPIFLSHFPVHNILKLFPLRSIHLIIQNNNKNLFFGYY